jgi:hypothetical protein
MTRQRPFDPDQSLIRCRNLRPVDAETRRNLEGQILVVRKTPFHRLANVVSIPEQRWDHCVVRLVEGTAGASNEISKVPSVTLRVPLRIASLGALQYRTANRLEEPEFRLACG